MRAGLTWLLGLASLAAMLGFFVANVRLARYVDEADNLLGGQLMAEGYRLYGDYFSHHMPLPYIAMAIATKLGAHTLELYRLSFALLLTIVLAATFALLHRRVSPIFLSATAFTIGLGHPVYLGYMVLADHWFAYALLILVLLALTHGTHFGLRGQLVVAACVFVAIGSTLISVYPLAALLIGYAMTRWGERRVRPIVWRREVLFGALIAAPWLVLLAVFTVQGVLGTFFMDAINFNQRYYARYDIGGDPATMLGNAAREFMTLVATYANPTQWHEVETVLLVANIGAVVVLARQRSGRVAALYAVLIFLSRMRGPGYHGAPYFVLSFASVGFVVDWALRMCWTVWVRSRTAAPVPRWTGVAGGTLAALVLAYATFFYRDIGGFVLHLPRGQGVHSPYSASVAALTLPGEKIWVAPLDPTVYLDTDRRPASVYSYFHPWLADSPEITTTVLRDIGAERPPVIVFEADKHIDWLFALPTPAEYAPRVLGLIRANYQPVDPADGLLRNVYVRNDLVGLRRLTR
ncbi:MAG: hypothetical protein NVSMB2_01680 [Chloroflexota bacterium]